MVNAGKNGKGTISNNKEPRKTKKYFHAMLWILIYNVWNHDLIKQ